MRSMRLDASPPSVYPDQQGTGSIGSGPRLTHQLPRYFSWRSDPAAEATDAFTQNWNQI